jgi:hypothetical protein
LTSWFDDFTTFFHLNQWSESAGVLYIKNIEIFDDKIALNMYINQPIEGILPNMEFLENALKAQNPTENGEVVALNSVISPGGQKWGG